MINCYPKDPPKSAIIKRPKKEIVFQIMKLLKELIFGFEG